MEHSVKSVKILWNSNAAFTPTGYGGQTGNVCYRLLKAGYDVRVAANYGLEGAALGFNGLIQYPRLFAEFGEDALKIIIDNWKPDVFVTLYDVWVGARSHHFGIPNWFSALHPKWVCWTPVDQFPIPEPVANQARLAYKVVAMSEFGKRELERAGINSTCIPHGVESKVFQPLAKKDCKQWRAKHSAGLSPKATLDENNFIVGINAANKDPFRKDFARMFAAFQIFINNNPDAKKDARLDVHSWMQFPGGFDLTHLARKLGITDYVRHTFTYDMLCAMPPEQMAKMYSAFDIFLNLSRGEGFGIPQLEAMACGTPVIATDFTAMTELVKGHGWLVPPYAGKVTCPECKHEFTYNGGALQMSHLMSLYAIPDEWKAAEAIEDAYNHPEKRLDFGKASREFALKYDFDTAVLPLWLDLLGDVSSESRMFGKDKSKDLAFAELFKKATAG